MGVAGISAALVSNASALMLDGLFSGVNFLAAVLAARVSRSIQRRPDVFRPFGYEIDESVYVMFRSLVLVGIIVVAGFNACDKVVNYVSGDEIQPIKLNWIVWYMAAMVITCFGLAFWHHRNWLATKRNSKLLETERTGAMIDGLLSAGAGAAFLVISLLKGGPLDFLVPISDSLVVLGLASIMIWRPLGAFGGALKEVVGVAADESTNQCLRKALDESRKSSDCEIVDTAMARLGRSLFAVAYLRPLHPVGAKQMDELRDQLLTACVKEFQPTPIRMEFIFTDRAPFARPKDSEAKAPSPVK